MEEMRNKLARVLKEHGITDADFLDYTVAALIGFAEEAKQTPDLTAPESFKEVSLNSCKNELVIIAKQASKLKEQLAKMSHSATTELFYSSHWTPININDELKNLIEAASKPIQQYGSVKKGRPEKEVAKRLTKFLLSTWETETGKKAKLNTWGDENHKSDTFLCFVTAIFETLGIKYTANPERAIKNVLSEQDKTAQ